MAPSVSGVVPWVNITQTAAVTACQAQGSRYDIISNAEWQTVAQNIELVAANWSGGTIGSVGGLNAGTNNGHNSAGVAASPDDTKGCYLTGAPDDSDGFGTCPGGGWDSQKRTFTLSNGNVVWDMAGNVFQWVKDLNVTNFGAANYTSLITAASNPTTGTVGSLTGNATFLFGPSGNYTALNSGAYGGLGYANINSSAGAILRGGNWDFGTVAGVFAAFLSSAPTDSFPNIGFRCVYH